MPATAEAVSAAAAQVAALVEKGAFTPLRRYLPDDVADDRIAEGIALTLQMATRYAAQGRRLDDAVLVHHARLRALDPHRHLVPSKGRGLDPLHPMLFVRGRVEVVHLEGLLDDDGEFTEEGDRALGFALTTAHAPEASLASALDLRSWLESDLPAADVALLSLRFEGMTLAEISEQLEVDPGYVCTRLRALGRELAARTEQMVPTTRRGRPRRSAATKAAA